MARHQTHALGRVLLLATVVSLWAYAIRATEPAQAKPYDAQATEAKVRRALETPTTVEFTETSLQDVVDFLKEQHEIEIQLDTKAMDDDNVPSDTRVTVNLKGISLKSALRLMLGKIDLTYVVKDEVLLITTPGAANGTIEVRV
jgi:hypothetical protein